MTAVRFVANCQDCGAHFDCQSDVFGHIGETGHSVVAIFKPSAAESVAAPVVVSSEPTEDEIEAARHAGAQAIIDLWQSRSVLNQGPTADQWNEALIIAARVLKASAVAVRALRAPKEPAVSMREKENRA